MRLAVHDSISACLAWGGGKLTLNNFVCSTYFFAGFLGLVDFFSLAAECLAGLAFGVLATVCLAGLAFGALAAVSSSRSKRATVDGTTNLSPSMVTTQGDEVGSVYFIISFISY